MTTRFRLEVERSAHCGSVDVIECAQHGTDGAPDWRPTGMMATVRPGQYVETYVYPGRNWIVRETPEGFNACGEGLVPGPASDADEG